MKYQIAQTRYRCHCGSGIYLGYRFYPQPYYLLLCATLLRKDNNDVKLVDQFNDAASENISDAYLLGTGEYAADVQYEYKLPSEYMKYNYTGVSAWFNRHIFNNNIVEPEQLVDIEPAWDLINFELYPKVDERLRACLRLSYGCPNRCDFCPVPIIFKHKYHRLNLDFAIDQITYLYKQRNIREFALFDDNIFADVELGKRLLEMIIQRNIDARFFMQEGFEVKQLLDKELCLLMHNVGIYNPRIGIETLSVEALKLCNKPYQDADMAITAINNLQGVGFKDITVFLIQGLKGNTRQNEAKDIDIISKTGCQIRNHRLIKYKPNIKLVSQCMMKI